MKLRGLRFLFASTLLAAALGFSACAHVYTAHGAYYRVRPGDTLDSIAARYKTEAQDLAEVNNVESSEELKPGTSLYIPGVTPSKFAAILKKEGITVAKKDSKKESKKETKEPKESKSEKDPKKKDEKKEKGDSGSEETAARDQDESNKGDSVKTERGRFMWPVQGEISSLFGMRRGRRHDGLDIRAKTGTPVYAAAEGDVVYAKKMRGYGNLVLLKHDDDFFTVYAHNSVNLVKLGSKVKKGQLISRVGRTGRATGPHLHFEVREGSKARNPLFFLPKTAFAEKAKERKVSIDEDGHDEEGGFDGEIETKNP